MEDPFKGGTLPPNSVHTSTTLESSVSREWEAANAEKDDIKRSKQIAELLNKIPKGNKTNIEFLFDFLARLNGEEVFACHKDTVSAFNSIQINPRNLSKSELVIE